MWFALRLALVVVLCCLPFGRGQVIVKKAVVNTEVTPATDVAVNIAIYNLGKSPVFDLQLNDDTWADKFDLRVGLSSAKWERLAAGANVTHSFVLTPRHGELETNTYLETSPATVQYSDAPKGTPHVCYSAHPGKIRILSRNAAERRSAPHLKEWGVFAIFALLSILAPFSFWRSSKMHSKKEKKKRA